MNGIAQRQGFGASAQPDPAMANAVDPLFDWQKKVGLKTSRFGAAPAQPTHDNWGPLVVPPAASLHDGRQPLLLEGQPLLGLRAEGERPRPAAVRVLLVQRRRQRSSAADDHRHQVEQDRTLDQVVTHHG